MYAYVYIDMSSILVRYKIIFKMYIQFVFCVEMDTSNLKDVLKQLNSRDQPHDSHINSDCKYLSVDDLMPILEMSHRVSDAKCLPYYEFISEKLLEMITNVHILELLTVDDVTKSGIRKESIVEKLINNGRHPARQVSLKV